MDPLDDLPPESRADVVAAVAAAWEVDASGAEEILCGGATSGTSERLTFATSPAPLSIPEVLLIP